MKTLLPVVKLVSRQKLRKLDILTDDLLNAKSSKFRELYDSLQDGEVRNDREAAQLLYEAGPTDSRYRQLKSRFKKRLFNTLFFVDQNQPHQSAFDKTYHNCQRDWSLINILRANGLSDSARPLAKSLLACSQRYGFAELAIQSSRFLADCAVASADAKETERYEQLVELYSSVLKVEMETERHLRQLRLLARADHQTRSLPQTQHQAAEHLGAIEALARQVESPLVGFDAFEARCLHGEVSDSPLKVASAVEEALAWAAAQPRQMQQRRMFKLHKSRLAALTKVRDLDAGIEAAAELAGTYKAGSDEWQETQRLSCSLLISCDAALKALQLARASMLHRSYVRLPATEQEAWMLTEALAYLFATSNSKVEGKRLNFDVAAFVRREPRFGGEHKRLNAWRLLISAMFHLRARNMEAAGTAIGNLRKLAIKSLDAKRDARLIATAQVLYRMERAGFHKDLDRVGERYLHTLTSFPFSPQASSSRYSPIALEDMLELFGLHMGMLVPG